MAYTMADLAREVEEEILAEATVEQRLAGIPAEEILKRFQPEERLKGLSIEDVEAYLPKLKGR